MHAGFEKFGRKF